MSARGTDAITSSFRGRLTLLRAGARSRKGTRTPDSPHKNTGSSVYYFIDGADGRSVSYHQRTLHEPSRLPKHLPHPNAEDPLGRASFSYKDSINEANKAMIHHGIGRSFALRYRFRGQDEVNARRKSYRIVKTEQSDRRIRLCDNIMNPINFDCAAKHQAKISPHCVAQATVCFLATRTAHKPVLPLPLCNTRVLSRAEAVIVNSCHAQMRY